jgi:hypothetical protein
MVADGGGTCKKSIERHERGDSGKDGEQSGENNSGGNRE